MVARFGKEDFGRDHKLVYVCNIIDYMLFSALPIQNVAPMGMLKLSIKIYITKKNSVDIFESLYPHTNCVVFLRVFQGSLAFLRIP